MLRYIKINRGCPRANILRQPLTLFTVVKGSANGSKSFLAGNHHIVRAAGAVDDHDITAAVKQAQTTAEQTPEKPALLPSEMYNQALADFNKQSYDLAVEGFKLYINTYPEGENIDQAYVYLGDAYTAQEQAKPAAIAYATILQKFPKSKLTATARLKYARSIIPLGKTEEAKRYLNSVVQDFGRSPEARLAKEELAKLK